MVGGRRIRTRPPVRREQEEGAQCPQGGEVRCGGVEVWRCQVLECQASVSGLSVKMFILQCVGFSLHSYHGNTIKC